MSEPSDPPRIVDSDSGASPRLKALVERSRTDVGTETEVRALEARLSPMLWPGGGSGPATASASVGAKAGVALAIKVGAALVLVGGGGVWLSSRHVPQTQAPSPSATVVVEPPDVVPPATPALAAPPAIEVADGAASAPQPAVHEHQSPTGSVSEADLLGQAQASLKNDPSKALSLAERHRRLFPRGVLAQEREVIAIEALSRLGRHADAKARGDRFLRAFPGSAHRNKVRSLVEVE